MTRKLVVVLLAAVLCLIGMSSALAYNESPMLKVKVAAGELPPVEERLPEEPLVLEVFEEIGQYGGNLRTFEVGRGWNDGIWTRTEGLLGMSNDTTTTLPSVAKDWKQSEDGKTFTLYLRKGLKWSDGEPFTADDILFWWEDIILNDDYTPVKPRMWMPGDELMKVEKEGDYTVNFRFSTFNAGIVYLIRSWDVSRGWDGKTNGGMYAPKHYLKKWHPKYNPKAVELAKEEGFASWVEAFAFHGVNTMNQQDANRPTLGMFKLKEVTTAQEIWERNPYYFKVDSAGNQLPYIDYHTVLILASADTIPVLMLAGDIDFACTGTGGLADVPLLRENEEKGGFRVPILPNAEGSSWDIFAFNLNHPDPVLRNIFQDIRWGHAMSLAIDREELKEVLFFGGGTPRQYTVHPSASFYEERWGKAYAEYDSEEANRLLDEMGLDKRDSAGFRLRPDGKTLQIMLAGIWPSQFELPLIKEYWDDVGVKTDFKQVDDAFYWAQYGAAQLDLAIWAGDRMTEGLWYAMRSSHWDSFTYAPLWGQWLNSDGKEGEEPPDEIKHIFEVQNDWRASIPGTEEYKRLAKEICDFFAEHIYVIGTVGMTPYPVYLKDNLRNFDESGMLSADSCMWVSKFPAQWFFKQK